jgi:hypothetical protein
VATSYSRASADSRIARCSSIEGLGMVECRYRI